MADNTKYKFNGKEKLGKRNLAKEIINKYLLDNLNKSYNELKSVFNFSASNRHAIFYNQEEFDNWNNRRTDKTKRYFEPIDYNDEKIHICNQWSIDSIKPLLDLAKNEFKYDIQLMTESSQNFIKKMQIKNIILYGAPGVGKTHNYQNLISMIEEGKSQKEIFDTISKNEKIEQNSETFKTIKEEKRVEFVTFHQSYSYEDFIEGFRPNENGNIKLEDGIFKVISDEAKNNLEKSQKDTKEISKEILFKEKLELFKEILEEEIEKNGYYAITDAAYLTSADIDAFRYNIRRENPTYKYDLRMKFEDLYKFDENDIKTRKDIKILNSINPLANQHASYYFKVFDTIKNIKIDIKDKVEKIEQQNFYIVIDEINRGNISKIFGELITLIEEDKRDNYEVKLPYSKKSFKIPSNLYIIATMNSTDKSIATIDIALRRRFTFLKMEPNPNLVKNTEAKELMKKLNEFIEKTLGEDNKLGHSYFMKVKNKEDLDFVKEYKIKPLLQEYFYADDRLKEVLDILDKEDS